MSEPGPAEGAWDDFVAAAALAAIDPAGLGGLVLRGQAGPVRDRCLLALRALLGPGAPVRRMPLQIAEARLLGGLDLPATLGSGRPVLQRGLLAEADAGFIVIPMAERLPLRLAAHLSGALDTGFVAVERDGFAARTASRFGVVLCDEAIEADERPPAILTERLAFRVDIDGLSVNAVSDGGPTGAEIAAARGRLDAVLVDEAMVRALAEASLAFGVFPMRALLFACAAARASAALKGDDRPDEACLALAARLVLAPRATTIPVPPEPDDKGESDGDDRQADASPPPPGEDRREEDDARDEIDPRELAERIIAAVAASIPADVLHTMAQPRIAARRPSDGAGRAGASTPSKRRGRPIGARPGVPDGRSRLDLVETLRAAAPWQRLRRGAAAVPGMGGAAILVRREDFRIARLKERRQTTTIFVVDASGSAALHRLAEAKGAVELLLAECYVRRDQVALISFGGKGVDLLLPPTRSLAKAKRGLSGLPGGGGTPLAGAIDAAGTLAESIGRRGDTATLVFLTDGQANIARDGTGGRKRAQDEAMSAAQGLRARSVAGVVIDVSPRPQARARDLAEAMGARYVPLPSADARAMTRAIRAGD